MMMMMTIFTWVTRVAVLPSCSQAGRGMPAKPTSDQDNLGGDDDVGPDMIFVGSFKPAYFP